MSIRKGLTLPNRQWEKYTDLEVGALDVLKPDTLVWLVYGNEFDVTHQAQLKIYFDKYPQTRVIYRPYADNIPQQDPVQWADECWNRIKGLTARPGVPVELICDNERNLAVEHGDENWGRHVDWLTKFAPRWHWHDSTSPTKLHMGALSPSGNYQTGLNYYKEAGVYSLFDVVDAHVYYNPVNVVLPPTTKPICITEFNQWDPAKFLDYYDKNPQVTDAVYFILGGTKDQAQYDLLNLPGAKVYLPFKDWTPKPVPPPKPAPTTGGTPIMTIPADYTSPNHGNHRPRTTGIVLHATFSGRHDITQQQEYESTCNYFNDPAPGGDSSRAVSAHAVVHLNQIHYPVYEDDIAWHCLTWNGEKLGIEIACRFPGDTISSLSLLRAAKQCADWCVKYNIPPVWSSVKGIEEHHNMPNNDHQDIGPGFDRADFMKKVIDYMPNTGVTPIVNRPAITLDPATKKIVLDDLDFLWAYSSATQTSRNPAEAEKVMRERIVGLKAALGLNS